MEAISLKLDKGILKDIDNSLAKFRFCTRTEFIRTAIRDKLSDLEKEEALKNLKKYFGASKTKITDKELHEARERAVKSLAKKRGWKLD